MRTVQRRNGRHPWQHLLLYHTCILRHLFERLQQRGREAFVLGETVNNVNVVFIPLVGADRDLFCQLNTTARGVWYCVEARPGVDPHCFGLQAISWALWTRKTSSLPLAKCFAKGQGQAARLFSPNHQAADLRAEGLPLVSVTCSPPDVLCVYSDPSYSYCIKQEIC